VIETHYSGSKVQIGFAIQQHAGKARMELANAGSFWVAWKYVEDSLPRMLARSIIVAAASLTATIVNTGIIRNSTKYSRGTDSKRFLKDRKLTEIAKKLKSPV
jgi:hypothetical protein